MEKYEEIAENMQKQEETEELVKVAVRKCEKPVIPKEEKKYINPQNAIIDNLQLRLTKLEYEFMLIREKMFSFNPQTKQHVLNSLGKQVKRRLRSSL